MEAKVVIPNVAANAVPHLLLRYDTQRIKIRPIDVMAELRKGTPSIELNPQTGKKPGAGLPSDENTIVVGVWMLEPGEELIVARRIKEILEKAA
jgi:L-seryl-tRNA(Ser) seleniumtransferase